MYCYIKDWDLIWMANCKFSFNLPYDKKIETSLSVSDKPVYEDWEIKKLIDSKLYLEMNEEEKAPDKIAKTYAELVEERKNLTINTQGW